MTSPLELKKTGRAGSLSAEAWVQHPAFIDQGGALRSPNAGHFRRAGTSLRHGHARRRVKGRLLATAMKPWLRLTLITMTVGGGFTGVAVTLQSLVARQS